MTSLHATLLLALVVVAGCSGDGGGDDGPRGGAPLRAVPGSIHTVAGTGSPGYAGEDMAARESPLFWPDDVALGPDGRLCILDWNNHRVRIRRPDGTLETVLGAGLPGDSVGPATEALINHPTAAAWDAQGRLVVACWHNHKIKRVEANGEAVILAGGEPGYSGDGGPAAEARLRLPSSILFEPGGGLLVLDTGNWRLRRIRTDGVIETVAGRGTRGHSGDGGPAADAEFAFPDDGAGTPGGKMCFDREGRVLIADAGSHTVRRIEADGTIVPVAGTGVAGFSGDGGPATEARLAFPVDVEVGPDGSLFIADRDNDRVRRVAPDGTISTVAGGHVDAPDAPDHEHSPFDGDGGPATRAVLRRPAGIALDDRGNLYLADRDDHTVRVVVAARPGRLLLPAKPPGQGPPPDPGIGPRYGVPGGIDTVVGSGATGFSGDGLGGLRTDLYWPVSVAVRASGEIVFSDWNNHRIRMVRADGLVLTVMGNGFPGDGVGHSEDIAVFHPTGVALAPGTGDLYVAAWHNYRVKRHSWLDDETVNVAGTGVNGFSGDGGPAAEAALDLPSSVAFGPDGSLYVSDEGNGRIRRIAPDGTVSTFAGDGTTGFSGDGGPAVEAALGLAGDTSGRPTSFLAVDADGRVFIADTLNQRVRRVDLDGIITTVAGNGTAGYAGDGGPAVDASLRFPVGVAVDGDGTLWIADRDNHAVRRVDPSGTITTAAGDGTPGFAGDGGPAAAARLREPHGLALDAAGNLYVADLGNGRIRVLWSGREQYERVIHPLFRDSCAAAGCHSGAFPQKSIPYDTGADASWNATVGVPSTDAPGWTLVVPFNPDASWLMQKLNPTVTLTGDRMPQGRLPLGARELAVVRAWIESGAAR